MATAGTGSGIVVGVDGSSTANAAIRWAARDAATRNVPLTIVHAAAPPLVTFLATPVPTGVLEWQQELGRQILNDATRIANSTAYGLSSAVCTNRLDYITRLVTELNVGTVNVREVPGYRLELTPFGGIKDSGLGYKEGVQEAMKSFTNTKTSSLPW